MGRSHTALIMDKDFLICPVHTEHIVIIDDRFRAAQEQIAMIVQRHVEDGKQISLQHRLEINQNIAAADQIQFPERRILEHIVLCKNNHLANIVMDDILIALAGKKPGQPGDGNIFNNVIAVHTLHRRCDRSRIQICCKDFYIPLDAEFLHGFLKQDGNGISFLAGRASGYPHTNLFVSRRVLQKLLNHGFLENVKIFRIAEKAGNSDQHFLGQQFSLIRIVIQIGDILPQITAVRDNQTALDSSQNGRLLIIGVIDAGGAFQNRKYLRKQILIRQLQLLAGIAHGNSDVRHLLGNRIRFLNQIRKAGGNRITRHSVEFCRFR